MSIDKLYKNAPADCQGYFVVRDNTYYVKKVLGVWHISYNYDCGSDWGLLNTEYINKIKPLY